MGAMRKDRKKTTLKNKKETKRAIKAAVDQANKRLITLGYVYPIIMKENLTHDRNLYYGPDERGPSTGEVE